MQSDSSTCPCESGGKGVAGASLTGHLQWDIFNGASPRGCAGRGARAFPAQADADSKLEGGFGGAEPSKKGLCRAGVRRDPSGFSSPHPAEASQLSCKFYRIFINKGRLEG